MAEKRMLILVCYDVATETTAGRRRLRRVARVCEAMGQRVQKSVFECRITALQLEAFERSLLAEIEESEDCLRLYRLTEPSAQHVREFGKFTATDFTAPLVV